LVRDIAGNLLDGEFAGAFPTGNGHPGGDFTAQFNVNSQKVVTPTVSFATVKKAELSSHTLRVSHRPRVRR
jgi:hypothetical protein